MSLRVLFCGTPEFAVPTLNAVALSPHELVGVVTIPDRPQGRGRTVRPSAVHVCATQLEVPVLQPEALDDPSFLADVRSAAPDIILVVAFRILPKELYGIPRLGAINVHASLLPEYRGAAPIARALFDGRTETGVTTFQIVRRVDRGGILKQQRVRIASTDNAGTLSDKLSVMGSELALSTLTGLEDESLSVLAQDAALATKAPKLTSNDRPVRWDEPAQTSHNRVRALAPAPGAFIRRDQKILKVLETAYDSTAAHGAPGEIIDPGHTEGIAVATGTGTLFLRQLQPEGKSIMPAAAYLRGRPIAAGERFEHG
jgi:methionyl-tRNA formyltransferase